jgi:hypothetical protein
MSHRVIQVDSKVSSKKRADSLQQEVKRKLDSESYGLHNREVNDGEDLEGNATLSVKTDHNNSTEANSFYSWLWDWAQNNQASYNSDDSVESDGLTRFRIQVHDCKHLEGLDEPCEIGDADKFDLR